MDKPASNTSLHEFLVAIASAEGPHGSVSAAAVSAGLGTAVLLMVTSLPHTRSDSMDDRTRLAADAVALNQLRDQLLETVETETAVKIFAARNLPQASERQRADRHAAIQFALRASADVPLEVMRLSARALGHAASVAAHASRAASADVHFGIGLLQTAFDGSRAGLEAKLSTLVDAGYVTAIVDEIARLSNEVSAAIRATDSLLDVPPA